MMESALFFSCSFLVWSLWSPMSLLSSFQSQLQASWILLHHKARNWDWSCPSAAMEAKRGWGESTTLSRGAPWGIGLPTAAHWATSSAGHDCLLPCPHMAAGIQLAWALMEHQPESGSTTSGEPLAARWAKWLLLLSEWLLWSSSSWQMGPCDYLTSLDVQSSNKIAKSCCLMGSFWQVVGPDVSRSGEFFSSNCIQMLAF